MTVWLVCTKLKTALPAQQPQTVGNAGNAKKKAKKTLKVGKLVVKTNKQIKACKQQQQL